MVYQVPDLYTAAGGEFGAAGLQHQHGILALHSKAASRGIYPPTLQPAFGASSVPGIPKETFPVLRLYLDHLVCFNGVRRTSRWAFAVGAFVRHLPTDNSRQQSRTQDSRGRCGRDSVC